MNSPPRIYLSSPHMGPDEFEFVKEAFATNWIAPLGPHVDGFEKEFVDTLARVAGAEARGQRSEVGGQARTAFHAAALSSGTAALHLALKLVGLKAGEEVFVSSLTFSASVNPIAYEGGKPVFIDSERQSWNMAPALLEQALKDRAKRGKLPRAVIAVHLYGQCADIDAIGGLCEQYDVPLIEDAAEALGAIFSQVGQFDLDDGSQRAGGRTPKSWRGATADLPGLRISGTPGLWNRTQARGATT